MNIFDQLHFLYLSKYGKTKTSDQWLIIDQTSILLTGTKYSLTLEQKRRDFSTEPIKLLLCIMAAARILGPALRVHQRVVGVLDPQKLLLSIRLQ